MEKQVSLSDPPKTPAQAEELRHSEAPITEDQEQGVARIELLFQVFGRSKFLIALYCSIFLICYASSLSSNTVYSFLPFATSAFGEHSMLGTIAVINAIAGAVCQPFVAKIADITSRPTAYCLSLILYTLGFVLLAASPNVSAVAAGQVFYTLGDSGLTITTTILVGDLTPLQWRSFANGIASSPYIVNAFIAGFIVTGVTTANWRWGFGMFAIIMPVTTVPALIVLFYADIKAKKRGLLSLSASTYTAEHKQDRKSWLLLLKEILIHIDAFGLLVLGFAWALILLPFTLSAGARDGYANRSLIAMFVVGGILMIVFFVYESLWAPFPILPRRVLNRTFIVCVIIDFMYYFSGYMGSTYYSSWVWVIKDWTLYQWTCFLNTLGVGLCLFGIVVGVLQRVTHRYKWLQICGLCLYVLGVGLAYYAVANPSTVVLVMSQIIISMGGACSVLGTQVASQASVPHADLAIVASNLSLWTKLGGSIGNAISASYWTNNMPKNLARYLGGILTIEEITAIFGDLTEAKAQTSEARIGVLAAYNDTVRPLYAGAIGIAAAALIASFFASNYRLDKKMNAVTDKIHPVYAEGRTADDATTLAGSPGQSQLEKIP